MSGDIGLCHNHKRVGEVIVLGYLVFSILTIGLEIFLKSNAVFKCMIRLQVLTLIQAELQTQKAILGRKEMAFRLLVMRHPDTNADCALLRLRKAEGDLASEHVRCVSGSIYIPEKLPPFARSGKVMGEPLIILLRNVKIIFCPLLPLSVYIFNFERRKGNVNDRKKIVMEC